MITVVMGLPSVPTGIFVGVVASQVSAPIAMRETTFIFVMGVEGNVGSAIRIDVASEFDSFVDALSGVFGD
jgi:hypothetical protein